MKATQTGDTGEAAFLLAAIERGLIVYKPFGCAEAVDFIVDTGTKLIRVQVKAANWITSADNTVLQFLIASKRSDAKKISDKFDVLVCYDINNKDFYILKSTDVRTSLISFSSKTKQYPSKNNWSLFHVPQMQLKTNK